MLVTPHRRNLSEIVPQASPWQPDQEFSHIPVIAARNEGRAFGRFGPLTEPAVEAPEDRRDSAALLAAQFLTFIAILVLAFFIGAL